MAFANMADFGEEMDAMACQTRTKERSGIPDEYRSRPAAWDPQPRIPPNIADLSECKPNGSPTLDDASHLRLVVATAATDQTTEAKCRVADSRLR